MSATNEVHTGGDAKVRVAYRHVELSAAATMQDDGSGAFRLTLDAPPPVRTVLSIGARAYVVVAVTEVVGDGGARGCLVREVDSKQLPTTVGTEQLRDGSLGSAEPASSTPAAARDADEDRDGDGYGAHMAVPAPVVGEDSSEPIDVGDEDNGNGGEPASEETATPGEGTSRGKKRRGRQRK